MRSTANKLKIEDLINGEYIQSPEGDPNYLVTPWDQKVLRINLIATIVDSFVRDDGGYATLTLDDGTGTIRAKFWSDEADKVEEFQIGDLVTIVGKVREYEGEIHLVPEVVREVEDPNWELVRELEILENRKGLLQKGIKPEFEREAEGEPEGLEFPSESEDELERVGEIEDLGESLDKGEQEVSDELKDKILLILDKIGDEAGANIEDVSDEMDESPSEVEKALGVLLNEDKIYEPVAGKFKRLGWSDDEEL